MTVNIDVFNEYEAKYPAGHSLDSSSSPVSIFLYGLCRLVQPSRVVEIGTFHGATSIWLARAVVENKRGLYIGYEAVESNAEQTKKALESAVPGGPWTVHTKNFMEEQYLEADFVFLDHAKELYAAAFHRCNVPIGGYVVAHDTAAWPDAVAFMRYMHMFPNWELLNIQQELGVLVARRTS